MKYGLYTTVGSVIASWAVILKTVPAAARKGTAPVSMMALAAQTDVQRPTPQPAPGEVLLALAVCAEIESRAIVNPDDAVSAALNSALAAAKVPSATSEIAWRQLTFTDEIGSHRVLSLAQVAHQGGDAFRGSYLFEGGTLLARQEFVSHV